MDWSVSMSASMGLYLLAAIKINATWTGRGQLDSGRFSFILFVLVPRPKFSHH